MAETTTNAQATAKTRAFSAMIAGSVRLTRPTASSPKRDTDGDYRQQRPGHAQRDEQPHRRGEAGRVAEFGAARHDQQACNGRLGAENQDVHRPTLRPRLRGTGSGRLVRLINTATGGITMRVNYKRP
jgi:hypothetical protein